MEEKNKLWQNPIVRSFICAFCRYTIAFDLRASLLLLLLLFLCCCCFQLIPFVRSQAHASNVWSSNTTIQRVRQMCAHRTRCAPFIRIENAHDEPLTEWDRSTFSFYITVTYTHRNHRKARARRSEFFVFRKKREKNNAKDIAEIDVANESHFHQQISGIFRWSCVHAATNGLHFSGLVVRFCVLFHAHNHDDNSQQQQRRQTLSYTSRFCAVLLLLLLLFSTHLFLCGACFGFQSETIYSGTWKGRFAYETEMTRFFSSIAIS